MTITEKYIIKTYSNLFEHLSRSSQNKLINKLTKSLTIRDKNKENDFFESFGAFGSDQSAEEINKQLKENRRFKSKDFKI
jgi:uncharacterized membrane-anchored protein YhcB (DUF1043 family)